jgi:hypothetical protein
MASQGLADTNSHEAPAERVVFVELIEFGVGDGDMPSFEVDLTMVESVYAETDFDAIVKEMVNTIPSLNEVLNNCKLDWKVAGKHFPERYVDVGKKQIPRLKHQSFVKCYYTTKIMEATTTELFNIPLDAARGSVSNQNGQLEHLSSIPCTSFINSLVLFP